MIGNFFYAHCYVQENNLFIEMNIQDDLKNLPTIWDSYYVVNFAKFPIIFSLLI